MLARAPRYRIGVMLEARSRAFSNLYEPAQVVFYRFQHPKCRTVISSRVPGRSSKTRSKKWRNRRISTRIRLSTELRDIIAYTTLGRRGYSRNFVGNESKRKFLDGPQLYGTCLIFVTTESSRFRRFSRKRLTQPRWGAYLTVFRVGTDASHRAEPPLLCIIVK